MNPDATSTPSPAIVERLAEGAPLVEPNPFQRSLLFALALTGRHVYAGTVPADEVAKRRARGKAARKARRITRRYA
jgi:hypothetical protein